jgi:protein-L-isoaspartate(D-aspartate) O-methyltransferase
MKEKMRTMLDTIRAEAVYAAAYTGRSQIGAHVMQAMSEVDRALFVTPTFKVMAYDDSALPIDCGQTISQPYIVALMTDLLDLTKQSRVLEIGTGSGYQAAILSRLAKQVYSVETLRELAEKARIRLHKLGFDNVEVRCDNGYYGWQKHAPFDAVIVTAVASHIPSRLLAQLKNGGRMVIPIGLPYMNQELMLVTKNSEGVSDVQSVLDVAFVPMVDDPESIPT